MPKKGVSPDHMIRLSPLDEFDVKKPCYWLLGWTKDKQEWEKACPVLLTHSECVTVFEVGMEPYEKFLVVSPMEFNVLGMPQDIDATDYFSLAKQREVSMRNHTGKRATTPGQMTQLKDRITDPQGE